MFGIMRSALFAFGGFVFKSVTVKFVTFFALWFITVEFIEVLKSSGILPTPGALTGALGGIGAGTWFFLDLAGFSYGFPLVIAAAASRFIIRRLPVIG